MYAFLVQDKLRGIRLQLAVVDQDRATLSMQLSLTPCPDTFCQSSAAKKGAQASGKNLS